MYFSYQNIEFQKSEGGEGITVKGEICNNSGKDYNSVAFRLILFTKNIPLGNVTIIINGFHRSQTRTFERQFGELKYDPTLAKSFRYEIYAESAY